MIENTNPTDDEAWPIYLASVQGRTIYEDVGLFARAVLAKWGKISKTEQPVGWWLVGTETVEFSEADYHDGPEWTLLVEARQTGRQPLPDKELRSMSAEYEDAGDEGLAFRDGWRAAERYYGITGGKDA